MNLVVVERNGVVIVRVKEERLDAHISNDLKNELKRLYEDGKKNILVDMVDVRFIDSSGLGAFVSALRAAHLHQGTLKLAGPNSQVQAMFELTRLNKILRIFPTTVEAIESE